MTADLSPPPLEDQQQGTSQLQTHDITSPAPDLSPTKISTSTENPFHTSYANFNSPTSTFNPEGYQPHYDPNPINGGRNDSYDSTASFGFDYSSYGSVPSTSHSMQSFSGGDDSGPGSGYWGYPISDMSSSGASGVYGYTQTQENRNLSGAQDHSTTPTAQDQMDDDRTPVVPSHQHHQPIHPSQLPSPHDAGAVRASYSSAPPPHTKPLLSPFRSFGHQPPSQEPSFTNFPSMPINDPSTFSGPSSQHTYYQQPQLISQPPAPVAYQPSCTPSFTNPSMSYSQPQQHTGYTQPIYAPQPQQASYGPPRSRQGSPAGSISSVASASVQRSQSISEVRPLRPKLTKEDKRNIVEMHKNNPTLRQEDIARQYGVDRSTISKIIIAKHRWAEEEEVPTEEPAPRPSKGSSGRFPEIDRMMSEWMDYQIAIGADVRDPIAREQAKRFALESGLDHQRFKASAKWLDKFKDRRKAAGKPISNPTNSYSHQPYPATIHTTSLPTQPLASSSGGLVRSHSTMTLSSSSSSSQEPYVPSPACVPADRLIFNRSDTDLIRPTLLPAPGSFPLAGPAHGSMPSHNETTPQAPPRARSQSSPHTLTGAAPIPMQTPSSGKHVRPSPLALQRQNSYHGSSPSPRRPLPPSRANSSQGPLRRSRPGSLAASAFGITALDGDGPYSPVQSPTTSLTGSVGGHSRRQSQQSQCLTPFTTSMATMALSPDISDSGDLIHSASTSSVSSMPNPLAVPPHTPITPITPAHPSAHAGGVFPTLNPDLGAYGDMQQHYHHQHQQQQHQQQQHHQHQMHQAVYGSGGSHASGFVQQYASPAEGARVGHAPLQGYASMPTKHYGASGEYPGYSPTGEFGQTYGGQLANQGYRMQAGQGNQQWS